MKKFNRVFFIFRRDLRLDDNTALNAALEQAQEIVLLFFFDPRQVNKENKFKSASALDFMIESLNRLSQAIRTHKGRLYTFYEEAEKQLPFLCTLLKPEAVFFNKDYTPFARTRDEAIEKVCAQKGITCCSYDDAVLNAPTQIKNKQGLPYMLFTPFYKAAHTISVAHSVSFSSTARFFSQPIAHTFALEHTEQFTDAFHNSHRIVQGNSDPIRCLKHRLSKLSDYCTTRNIPSVATSQISAFLKFGTLSVRAAFHTVGTALGYTHPLLVQLYWRDFFTHTLYHFPHMLTHCLRPEYDTIAWEQDEAMFTRWKEGTTGFPIVDAGMRELNTTGFMHNRVRMIVASFLTKDLHYSWQQGAQYFAQQLVDYDPAVNAGNWQWSASVGIDAQPYFRIFNPWLGQKKYDPECIYIKQWIPELASVAPRTIHTWHTQKRITHARYPAPLVDHTQERERALYTYKQAKKTYHSTQKKGAF